MQINIVNILSSFSPEQDHGEESDNPLEVNDFFNLDMESNIPVDTDSIENSSDADLHITADSSMPVAATDIRWQAPHEGMILDDSVDILPAMAKNEPAETFGLSSQFLPSDQGIVADNTAPVLRQREKINAIQLTDPMARQPRTNHVENPVETLGTDPEKQHDKPAVPAKLTEIPNPKIFNTQSGLTTLSPDAKPLVQAAIIPFQPAPTEPAGILTSPLLDLPVSDITPPAFLPSSYADTPIRHAGPMNFIMHQPASGVAQGNLVQHISATIALRDEGRFELRLDPPELGRVVITISHTETGVNAHIVADKSDIADLLRRHADIFARELNRSGVGNASLGFSHRDDSRPQPDEHGFAMADDSEPQIQTVQDIIYLDTQKLDIRL